MAMCGKYTRIRVPEPALVTSVHSAVNEYIASYIRTVCIGRRALRSERPQVAERERKEVNATAPSHVRRDSAPNALDALST